MIKEKVRPVMVSLKSQTKEVKDLIDLNLFADESAGETALTVLNAKKGRQESYERMMVLAGDNKSTGANELRKIAVKVRDGVPILV